MKKIFLGILFISTISTFSQELEWMTDFSEAAELSKKTNKPILANFTGSDWCHYCKLLDRQVFETKEFQNWAKENVILLELDFPRRKKISTELKKQNYALQNAFGVRGYPTIWLFQSGKGDDPKKDIVPLGKTGYLKGGPSKWIRSINQFMPKS